MNKAVKFSLALLCCAGLSGFGHHTTIQGWHTLNVGGGGQNTDIAFSLNGIAKVTRNDNGDAYIWKANANPQCPNTTTGCWMLLNTASNIPIPKANYNGAVASWAVMPAANDHNRIFLWYGPFMLKSDDGGYTFSKLANFPATEPQTQEINSGFAGKAIMQRIAFDPVNRDIAFACSSGQGLFKTTDGGQSWNVISTIPSSMPIAQFATKTTTGPTGTTVLNFASGATTTAGSFIWDVTNPLAIPAGTVVIGSTSTTITVYGGDISGVSAGDTIRVSAANIVSAHPTSSTTSGNVLHFAFNPPASSVGFFVYDTTNPSAIPPNTYITAADTTSMTISQNVTTTIPTTDSIIVVNSEIGDPNGAWPGCNVAFDPTTSSGGSTSTVYAFPSNRTIYKSTDGGDHWTPITGAPTSQGLSMQFGSDGTLWIVSSLNDVAAGKSNVWKCAPGCRTSGADLTQITTATLNNGGGGTQTLAVDPANPSHVVVGAYLDETIDGGTTWGGQSYGPLYNPQNGGNRVATDVPWIQLTNGGINDAALAFDPGASNKVYVADGIAVEWANPPNTGVKAAFNWNDQTAGMENLNVNKILSSPGFTGTVVTSNWDRPVFQAKPRNTYSTTYPSVQGTDTLATINASWDTDWASSNQKVVCSSTNWGLAQPSFILSSGCASDGSDVNGTWQNWASDPVTPFVTLSAQANSGTSTFSVVSVPDTLQVGEILIAKTRIGPLTTIAQTTTSANPAVLFFTPNSIPAALTTNYTVNSTHNVAPNNYLGWFRQGGNTISSINNGAGTVTLGSPLATIPIDSGSQIYFSSSSGILPGGTVTITAIDRVNKTVTISSPFIANAPAGISLYFSFATGNRGIGGQIAVSTPQNIIVLPEAPGTGGTYQNGTPWPWWTKDGGASWHPVVICSAGCTGFNADGSAIPAGSDGTGWGTSYFNNEKQVVADRVSPNTFYLWNCRTTANGGGLYANYNGGEGDWVRIYDGTIKMSSCTSGTKMETVPGVAGYIFLTGGSATNLVLYRTTNATCGTTSCSDFAAVPNTAATVSTFALGAPPAGGTFPTLYMVGHSPTGSSANAIWRSLNANAVTPTFTQISTTVINNGMKGPAWLEADKNVYGMLYASTGGMGAAWGYFPYLLKRDLDPVANDNSPAFMNMVG